jgi:hypothetical protein
VAWRHLRGEALSGTALQLWSAWRQIRVPACILFHLFGEAMHNMQPRIPILQYRWSSELINMNVSEKLHPTGPRMNKIMLLVGALLLLGLGACFSPDVGYSNTHPPFGDWTQR